MENSSTSTPSRLSPERWPTDAFALPYSVLSVVGIAGILVASVLLLLLGAARLGFPLPGPDMHAISPAQTTVMFVLQDLLYVPIVAFIFFILPRLAKRSLADLGLGVPRIRDLRDAVIGLIITVIAVYISSQLLDLFTHTEHHQKELAFFEHLNVTQAVICAITSVILGPFTEEVVFRLFLFNALLRYIPVGIAVVINGVLFALAHGQLDVAPPLAVCGIALALIYYRTGSLWANVFTHMGFNGITTAAILVFHKQG